MILRHDFKLGVIFVIIFKAKLIDVHFKLRMIVEGATPAGTARTESPVEKDHSLRAKHPVSTTALKLSFSER